MPTHDDAEQLYKQAVEAAGRGDHFKAKELFEGALELYREVPGAEKDQAHCLYSLATTLLILGKPAQAEPLYRQALTLYQTAPKTERNQAQCLYNLAISLTGWKNQTRLPPSTVRHSPCFEAFPGQNATKPTA